jgi:outer membrane protein TolC
LTGSFSYSSTTAELLFSHFASAWLLSAAVTHHKQKAAEAAYDQAEATYRSTVITAFQNVADSLRANQYDAKALKAAVHSEDAAFKSLEIVRKQAELGQVNVLAILTQQQLYLTALVTRVVAEANRYADAAALIQALGGGWWNRMDAAPNDDNNRGSGCREIIGPIVTPCMPVPSIAGAGVQPAAANPQPHGTIVQPRGDRS